MDIIKNPIVIAVIGGSVTYYYMQYKLNETNKIRKKKGKKPEELNLMIPLAIAFAIWFLAYMYFNQEKQSVTPTNIILPQQTMLLEEAPKIQQPMPLPVVQSYRFSKDIKSSPINLGVDTSESYEIIKHDNLKAPTHDFNALI